MVMGGYLWKDDKGLESRGSSSRLTGPHRSNKHISHARARVRGRLPPLDADASTSEVPETPQGYHPLSRRIDHPHPRKRHSRQPSIHCASFFPLVVQPTIRHSPPRTPTRRSRPHPAQLQLPAPQTPHHDMSVDHLAPSVYSKTETEPPSPLAIGPSRPLQAKAIPNSDESVTEPEPETD